MKSNVLSIFTVLFLLVLSGCSTVSQPGNIPDIGLTDVGPFAKTLSVALVNNQPDKSNEIYAGIGGHTYYANYNQWTQFFIDRLGNEMKKRGVNISDISPNKLRVKLSDFAYMQGMWVVRMNVKISLEMPEKNYKKEWIATDVSGWSAGRAMGSVLYRAIEQILRDPEIMNLLQTK